MTEAASRAWVPPADSEDAGGEWARDVVLSEVRRELVGPDPLGSPLKVPHDGEPVDAFGAFVDAETGEEVLTVQAPLERYGVAVLFPKEERTDGDDAEVTEANLVVDVSELADAMEGAAPKGLERIDQRVLDGSPDQDDEDDSQLVDATRRKPSSMAVTFRVRSGPGAAIMARLPRTELGTEFAVNGRYEPFRIAGRKPDSGVTPYTWWVRRQVCATARFVLPEKLEATKRVRLEPTGFEVSGSGPLALSFTAFVRRFPGGDPNDLIVTVALSNRSLEERGAGVQESGADGNTTSHAWRAWKDARCLFQAYFEVWPEGSSELEPLPGSRARDEAAATLELIYHEAKTWAVGHGCAADWCLSEGKRVIKATHFPVFEVPSMTPDLRRADGSPLEVSMRDLARADASDRSGAGLETVVAEYEGWLRARGLEIDRFHGREREVAEVHLATAQVALERMKRGLEVLRSDTLVAEAFRLMNEAMLLQQVASKAKPRAFQKGVRTASTFEPAFRSPLDSEVPPGLGRWRPFQVGFLLTALASVAYGDSEDRELVDLIWFPTGGGKTEAYLGLVAFSALLRRLRDPADTGTDTLMRYTLRLLTAQQFQRAASLICALEVIRRRDPTRLGETSFGIGLWVGGANSPNKWDKAVQALKRLHSAHGEPRNPFLVTECPWCKAPMGRVSVGSRHEVLGYRRVGSKVRFECPDPRCDFHRGLPLHVVDEGLYEEPPTLVIGTVDKFAQLAWNEKPRRFFGLDEQGNRACSPPNLIVQDELHLITGPLGTMVGSFEPLIEQLCLHGLETPRLPKVVCSTATVRNYTDQVKWLFGRTMTAVFPPPMYSVGDSFFGVHARKGSGELAPGRRYVGINATALGSHMAVQIRVYAAVLQAAMALPERLRDPYWTLLGFFNTLRDLGSTVTLLKDQVQGYLFAIWRRRGLLAEGMQSYRRRLYNVEELTGRLSSDEVPRALERLSIPYGHESGTVDVCLASNMIEVGIDVDRLGLMVVTGQPKTNAQYIQVTGRVGRDWQRRPGLVFTVYSPMRARDRSVFESFRTNHERMYAAVEPASVTPFSLPAMRRTLHASMVGFVRQLLPVDDLASPAEVDLAMLDRYKDVIRERLKLVDPTAANDFEELFERRRREWRSPGPGKWQNYVNLADQDVLLVPRSLEASSGLGTPWSTPTSMRNVDAECLVDVRVAFKAENLEA